MDSNDILILALAKSYTDAKTTEGKVTVDSSLSGTSTNPVQNKIITSEINAVKTDISDLKTKASTADNGIKTLNTNLTKTDATAVEAKTSAERANERIDDMTQAALDDLALVIIDGLLCIKY